MATTTDVQPQVQMIALDQIRHDSNIREHDAAELTRWPARSSCSARSPPRSSARQQRLRARRRTQALRRPGQARPQ